MKKTSAILLLLIIFFISCSKDQTAQRSTASVQSNEGVDDLGQFKCNEVKTFRNSKLNECLIPFKDPMTKEAKIQKFYTLKLKGKNFQDIAIAQGYLLADQIEEGALGEVLANIKGATSKLSPLAKAALEGINQCIFKHMNNSLSLEFNYGTKGLYEGYKSSFEARKLTPKFTLEDFFKANYSIELSNVATGILIEGMQSKIIVGVKYLLKCGVRLTSKVIQELFGELVDKGMMKDKFACSGIVATESSTKSGLGLIHARNLEQTAMINTWNKAPVIYIVDEGAKNKYVAFGSAGLIFPGGISGYNDKGISVSLHQMNTTKYKFTYDDGSAEAMPFFQQRILREASSIDEAINLVKKTHFLSSWTILISDAKTNEVASMELAAKKFKVVRQFADMGQSNHFKSPEMQKHHVHLRYSNYLETRGRLRYIENILKASHGEIDVAWMIKSLASHIDAYENQKRIFGRSLARVSNLMSTIVVPKQNEAWVTSGSISPANHSPYLGFKVDFDKLELSPLKMLQVAIPEKELKAYVTYVSAYKSHHDANFEETVKKIELASTFIDDPHLEYIKARLYTQLNRHEEAVKVYDHILATYPDLIPYTTARVKLYRLYSQKKEDRDISTIQKAKEIFNELLDNKVPEADAVFLPTDPSTKHAKIDLKNKLNYIEKLEKGKDLPKVDSVDLNSVD